MVIPWAEIQTKAHWWDSHFLSIDYGFGRSSAAAHLHVCLQDGRIVTVFEMMVQHTSAYDFARELVRRFERRTMRAGRTKQYCASRKPRSV